MKPSFCSCREPQSEYAFPNRTLTTRPRRPPSHSQTSSSSLLFPSGGQSLRRFHFQELVRSDLWPFTQRVPHSQAKLFATCRSLTMHANDGLRCLGTCQRRGPNTRWQTALGPPQQSTESSGFTVPVTALSSPRMTAGRPGLAISHSSVWPRRTPSRSS